MLTLRVPLKSLEIYRYSSCFFLKKVTIIITFLTFYVLIFDSY